MHIGWLLLLTFAVHALDDACTFTMMPTQTPYEMRTVLEEIVDERELFEVQPDFARNIITSFARLGGGHWADKSSVPISRSLPQLTDHRLHILFCESKLHAYPATRAWGYVCCHTRILHYCQPPLPLCLSVVDCLLQVKLWALWQTTRLCWQGCWTSTGEDRIVQTVCFLCCCICMCACASVMIKYSPHFSSLTHVALKQHSFFSP